MTDGSPARRGLVALLLWLWVGAALAAYLFAFRSLLIPILKVLGLA
jgi:hypothetical protein